MRLLLDTNLLVWAAQGSARLPRRAAELIGDMGNSRVFSALSVAEVAIKYARNRPDFRVPPDQLRALLLDNGYEELSLTGAHAARLADLPTIHKDPFDRLLVAQATAEGMTLVTADTTLGRYGPRVLVV